MRPHLVLAATALLLLVSGCGSRQFAKDIRFTSTSSDPVPSGRTKTETKSIDNCHYSVLTIPLGTEAAPENAYSLLSDGAIYVNNVEMDKTGWQFGSFYGRPLFGKTCWTAKGRVVTEVK